MNPIMTLNSGHYFVAICAALLILIKGAYGITIRRVSVPVYAIQGQDAVLECNYDLEGLALYSVKWYRNGMEFYRYLPSRKDPMTYFARPGVKVSPEASNERQVKLMHLTQQSTGRYRCEVSTEAPSFATDSKYGDMLIVVLPKEGPVIEGGQPRYSLGQMVNVNCTSRHSKPAADLAWSINGVQVEPGNLVEYPIRNDSEGLHSATLGLRFVANEHHFTLEGDMKLKCSASIGSVYWKSNEKSAEGFKQKRSDHYEERRDSYFPALDTPHELYSDNGAARISGFCTLGVTSLLQLSTLRLIHRFAEK